MEQKSNDGKDINIIYNLCEKLELKIINGTLFNEDREKCHEYPLGTIEHEYSSVKDLEKFLLAAAERSTDFPSNIQINQWDNVGRESVDKKILLNTDGYECAEIAWAENDRFHWMEVYIPVEEEDVWAKDYVPIKKLLQEDKKSVANYLYAKIKGRHSDEIMNYLTIGVKGRWKKNSLFIRFKDEIAKDLSRKYGFSDELRKFMFVGQWVDGVEKRGQNELQKYLYLFASDSLGERPRGYKSVTGSFPISSNSVMFHLDYIWTKEREERGLHVKWSYSIVKYKCFRCNGEDAYFRVKKSKFKWNNSKKIFGDFGRTEIYCCVKCETYRVICYDKEGKIKYIEPDENKE